MKLVNLIPGKEFRKESIEDMDTNLPAQMQKFLDRTINLIAIHLERAFSL